MATKFEPKKSAAYKRAEMADDKAEEMQHAKAARDIAKEEVSKHVKSMHKMAKGGAVRGTGAARKQKFSGVF